MRSKRKEVNKYAFKAVEEQREEHDDLLHRSTGIKPFQLVKVRQGQKSSLDLAHMNNEILHRRGGSNNLYSDEKEGYMDLIIKQKLIIDAQANQKLASERKNIISLERQAVEQPLKQQKGEQKAQNEEDEQQIYTETIDAYCVQPSHQAEQTEKHNEADATHEPRRKRSKCQCCLQLNSATHAIIRHKNQNNVFNNAQTEERESNGQESKAAEETMKELKAMKQRALPPFSFTSVKWRSKSEILQVDKWKEKYGKDMHLTQKMNILEKTVSTTRYDKHNRIKRDDMPSYPSVENQKMTLPILHKSKQLESKAKIFKYSPSKRQEKDIIKIYNPESDSHSTYLLLTNENFRKEKQDNAKRMKKQVEEKIQITIKKMYESEQKLQQTPSTQKVEKVEEEPQALPQRQKPKRKKSKFPEIQISTFFSTKEQEDERKRVRLQSIQRLAREWRYNPPKKVYLQKIMEEIPERWEYGDSRDSSREVDNYLQHQQEEAKRLQLEEERRLEQELQIRQTEEDFLCNAVIVRQ